MGTIIQRKLAAGSGSSVLVENCQICSSQEFWQVFFAGYLPPVNALPLVGSRPLEQPSYPAQLLRCSKCQLVQLGLIVDPSILFPPSYPYTSGTTKILRDNFTELYKEMRTLYSLKQDDLIVDIGSNDGTLLSNFKNGGHRVLGIEPTNAGNLAKARGIPTNISFFTRDAALCVVDSHGEAKVVTITNAFAHIEDIHEVVESLLVMLQPKGIFVSESHYLLSLVEDLQYDTVYHEHLRYYSLTSLRYLLKMHGLEVLHAKRIPTHGGSIRVYAARKGEYRVHESVTQILDLESKKLSDAKLRLFRASVVRTKLSLYALLNKLKEKNEKIYGIGAPSRASTLINYVGLDEGILDCVLEIKGSHKIGKYIPGTLIPVLDETKLYDDQPGYALLLSWHIAEELISNLTAKGFKGKYIIPLPKPMIVTS